MTKTTFDEMTVAERILHVQDLWDRITIDAKSVPVSDAWKNELDRRLTSLEADPGQTIPIDAARKVWRR